MKVVGLEELTLQHEVSLKLSHKHPLTRPSHPYDKKKTSLTNEQVFFAYLGKDTTCSVLVALILGLMFPFNQIVRVKGTHNFWITTI